MERDIWMLCQPRVTLLVRAVIIKNYVDFLIDIRLCYYLIHKSQKLFAPFQLCNFRLNLPGSYRQGSKQIECPMPLVRAFISTYKLAVVCFHIARLAF